MSNKKRPTSQFINESQLLGDVTLPKDFNTFEPPRSLSGLRRVVTPADVTQMDTLESLNK
jgi:hypothetical protein